MVYAELFFNSQIRSGLGLSSVEPSPSLRDEAATRFMQIRISNPSALLRAGIEIRNKFELSNEQMLKTISRSRLAAADLGNTLP